MTYLTLNEINSNAKFAPLGHDNKKDFIYRLDKELVAFKCNILLKYVKRKWSTKIKTQEALIKLSEKSNINFFKLYEFTQEKWGGEVVPDIFDSEPSYHDEYDEEETQEQFVPAYGECSRRLGKTAESRQRVNWLWIETIKDMLGGRYITFSNDYQQIIDLQDMNDMLNEVISGWSPEYKNLN